MGLIEHRQLIILGAGPAGLSAAIYAARAELKPLVITGMVLYGQASLTYAIENYPGFPNGIGGMQLGQLFEEQAKAFGAEFLFDEVQAVDLSKHPYTVSVSGGDYTTDALIIAMGANNKRLNVPGEEEFIGRGVSYCGTCDSRFYRDKDIHVVGGGDSALEEAIFLTRFAHSVTIIHRRDTFRAGPILENRARTNPKISFLLDSVVKEIRGHEGVDELLVENVKTGEKNIIPTDGIFIFIGHSPNTKFFEGQLEMEPGGTLKVNELMETNKKGVFAAGEIADPHFRQVVTSAGMGAAAAISATRCLETMSCGF